MSPVVVVLAKPLIMMTTKTIVKGAILSAVFLLSAAETPHQKRIKSDGGDELRRQAKVINHVPKGMVEGYSCSCCDCNKDWRGEIERDGGDNLREQAEKISQIPDGMVQPPTVWDDDLTRIKDKIKRGSGDGNQ